LKVFVTGSSGFIGRELVRQLDAKGHKVVGFSKSNGKDILNKSQLEQEMKGCEAVVHLAAELDEDSKKLFEINVNGTRNVLEAAAKNRVEHFVFISTTGVLGDFEGAADETFPYNPVTNYEKSKAEAERLVLSYQEVLPVTVLRPAIVVGPNEYWKKIINVVRKNLPLIGSGENYWQTIYYKDLCEAIVGVVGNEDALGEIYIVAEQNPKKLRELIGIIRKETGTEGNLTTVPVIVGKIGSFFLDLFSKITGKKSILNPAHVERLLRNRLYSTKKINALGWRSDTTTEQAIKETILEIGKQKNDYRNKSS
jgi:nucleoside-diphosphate-sugar epimerase